MKTKFQLLVFMLGINLIASAGNTMPEDSTTLKPWLNRNEHPVRKFYGVSGGELVFSFSDVSMDSAIVNDRMRFSLFPHFQEQFHFNYTKWGGFYVGVSMINLGVINEYTLSDNTQFELRQRTYSTGIPFALKFGDLKNGNYFAFGASAEFNIRYKYKIYYNGEKSKFTDWSSDKVNFFNPALFFEYRSKTGAFIRFKYYLDNFLAPVSSDYMLPNSTQQVTVTPSSSPIYYISIGSTFMKKKKPQKLTKDDV